jgi:hypothetical protein
VPLEAPAINGQIDWLSSRQSPRRELSAFHSWESVSPQSNRKRPFLRSGLWFRVPCSGFRVPFTVPELQAPKDCALGTPNQELRTRNPEPGTGDFVALCPPVRKNLRLDGEKEQIT